jgi:hypothetical protein
MKALKDYSGGLLRFTLHDDVMVEFMHLLSILIADYPSSRPVLEVNYPILNSS